MKFLLIDKIEAIEPGKRIVTSKNLTLAEEYLGDHFPKFPILPGVLMLEGMTQSAAWLVRLAQDYANSIVVLKTARNIRYSYFLKPGNTMRYEIDMLSINDEVAKFKGSGYVGDRLAVSAKIELMWKSMGEKGEYGKNIDQTVLKQLKDYFDLIGGPAALAAAEA